MKGLMMKDFLLLKNQKNFFIFLIAFAIFFGYENPLAGVSYLTFMSAMMIGNSMSYDEYDNGYAFLMTLPVTRKMYVISKYLLAIICSSTAWLVSTLVALMFQLQITPEMNFFEGLGMSSFILFAMLLLVSMMIPVRLKYGQSKASISVVLVSASIAVVCYLIYQLIIIFGINMMPLIQFFSSLGGIWIVLLVSGLVGIVLFGSYHLSCKIMDKKEL